MNCALIVVDMQNDFIGGCLGSEQALLIVPNVVNRVREYADRGDFVCFTRDSHGVDYGCTQEGRRLPIPHCLLGTWGHDIHSDLIQYADCVFDKGTFGSVDLVEGLKGQDRYFDVIELVGVCTDICVISNAFLLKTFFPESVVKVNSSCCAGVTKESHQIALDAMKACQIDII